MAIDDDAKLMADYVWSYWRQKGWLKPKTNWIELFQVCRFYLEECRKRGIDPQEFSLRDELDAQTSFNENKEKVKDLLKIRPSPEEQLESELERLAEGTEFTIVRREEKEKLLEYEEKIEKLRQKIKQLTEEKKQKETEAEEAVKKAVAWEEEAKKKPTIKIRVTQNFREGIMMYKAGDVIETHNVEWALTKVEQKLAERIGVELPVKAVPEAPPKERLVPREIPRMEERQRALTDLFIDIMRRNNVTVKPEHRASLRAELPTILQAATREEQEKLTEQLALEIVNEHKAKVELARRKRLPFPPTEIAERAEIPTPTEERRLPIPKAKLLPPSATLERWCWDTFKPQITQWYDKQGLEIPEFHTDTIKRWFRNLPTEEQRSLLAQYRTYFPTVKSISFKDWLKEAKGIEWEDYAHMDDLDKANLLDEYAHYS